MHMNAFEEMISQVIGYLVPLAEACGALVIVIGIIRTVVQYVRGRFRLDLPCLTGMRSQLVQSLVMGLEFQLAADVLETAISPTWNHILLLAALIALRAALSYLMERELHTLCPSTESAKGKSSETGAAGT